MTVPIFIQNGFLCEDSCFYDGYISEDRIVIHRYENEIHTSVTKLYEIFVKLNRKSLLYLFILHDM